MTLQSSDIGLLYKCFLGRFIPIEHIQKNTEGYLIYLESNDITAGLRVIIEDDLLTVRFF